MKNIFIVPEKLTLRKGYDKLRNMVKKTENRPLIIVGLGNPGEQYLATPHSAGFMVVDEFGKRFEFPDFKMEPDGILISRKELNGTSVILAKPQMFMNKSGQALNRLLARQKIRPALRLVPRSFSAGGSLGVGGKAKVYPNLWIINDDLDIPLGKIKIAKNRGSAGHKGVQSIIDQLKTKNFARLRVGIQTPEVALKKIPADRFVLKKIAPKEQAELVAAIDLACKALATALAQGIDKSMTIYNQ